MSTERAQMQMLSQVITNIEQLKEQNQQLQIQMAEHMAKSEASNAQAIQRFARLETALTGNEFGNIGLVQQVTDNYNARKKLEKKAIWFNAFMVATVGIISFWEKIQKLLSP